MRSWMAGVVVAVALASRPALAQEAPVFRLTLKDRRFEPAEVQVPAGQHVVLMVRNADAAPAEFESKELGVERIISAGRESTIRVGPLAPGRYAFFDEFHPEATGTVVVVASTAAKE